MFSKAKSMAATMMSSVYEKTVHWAETDQGLTNVSDGMVWFQTLRNKPVPQTNGFAEACVRLYSMTISSLPIYHEEQASDGSWRRVKNSKLTKLLRHPNQYQTGIEMMEYLVSSLLFDGNCYTYATRVNGQYEELHPLNTYGASGRFINDEQGMQHIFYTVNVSPNVPITAENIVTPLNMFHVKVFSNRDRLRGVSPLTNAAMSMSTNSAILAGSAAFFNNKSSPSGFLSTDLALGKDQVQQLREAWNNQSQHMEQGGIPIAAGGLKFNPLTLSSQDAQLVEAHRMTKGDIAGIMGVPLPLVDQTQGESGDTIEKLVNQWLAGGLGFYIKVFEEALHKFFDLPENERFNFDEKILMRVDFKTRLEALGKGVLHGIYAPDEAREIEGLPKVPDGAGERPFMQQQMIQMGSVNPTQVNVVDNPAETPVQTGDEPLDPDDKPEEDVDEDKALSVDDVLKMMKSL